jgi:hypothetical protein
MIGDRWDWLRAAFLPDIPALQGQFSHYFLSFFFPSPLWAATAGLHWQLAWWEGSGHQNLLINIGGIFLFGVCSW